MTCLFDNTQALSEGWDLFVVDGRFAIQKIDDPANNADILDYTEPKFESDTEAIIYVADLARKGSRYHYEALDLIGMLEP